MVRGEGSGANGIQGMNPEGGQRGPHRHRLPRPVRDVPWPGWGQLVRWPDWGIRVSGETGSFGRRSRASLRWAEGWAKLLLGFTVRI